MSQSIAIPRRSTRSRHRSYGESSAMAAASSASTAAASASSTNTSPSSSFPSSRFPSPKTPNSAAFSMNMSTSVPSTTSTHTVNNNKQSERRPSLLGSSLSHSEYTCINIAGPDGPPRLITCVKSSQGFDWNQDIFLPSYLDYDSSELERKPDPVQDIILTDEEAAAMLPR